MKDPILRDPILRDHNVPNDPRELREWIDLLVKGPSKGRVVSKISWALQLEGKDCASYDDGLYLYLFVYLGPRWPPLESMLQQVAVEIQFNQDKKQMKKMSLLAQMSVLCLDNIVN